MKDISIDPELLQNENPIYFSNPTYYYSDTASEYEGDKNRRHGLMNNNPYDYNENIRSFDKINIIPVVADKNGAKKNLKEVLLRLKQNVWSDDYNGTCGFEDIFKCELEFPDEEQWYIADEFSREAFEEKAHEITNNHDFKEGSTRNIVVFVTSSSSMNTKPPEDSEYHGMKKILLEGFIANQTLANSYPGVVYNAKKGKLSKYTLINIACQLYAKAGGIPWTLEQQTDETYAEINIGLRAARPKEKEANYVYGVAQIFSRNGKWIDSVVEQGNEVMESNSYGLSAQSMQKLLKTSLRKYESKVLANTSIDHVEKVNVHKLDGFVDAEIAGAKEFVSNDDVDVTLVGMQESQIRIYGGSEENPGNASRGYFKRLNENTGVLCTTGDYETKWGKDDHRLGTPVPLILRTVQDDKFVQPDIKDVAGQVFRLTCLNWDDAVNKEISKPVTINYAGRVSKKAADGIDITKITEDVPWFL